MYSFYDKSACPFVKTLAKGFISDSYLIDAEPRDHIVTLWFTIVLNWVKDVCQVSAKTRKAKSGYLAKDFGSQSLATIERMVHWRTERLMAWRWYKQNLMTLGANEAPIFRSRSPFLLEQILWQIWLSI